LLSQAGRQLRAEVLTPAEGRFEIRPATPATSSENQNKGDSVLALETPPGGATADLRLAVVFTPVGDRWPQNPLPRITEIAEWR
jgi:hypothetical protein